MKMRDLQKKQAELDNYIYQNMNIDGKSVFYEKIIALDVELSEFMNEIESFKYWKKNKGKKKILEEASDCLHFILSIANDMNVDLTVSTVISIPNNINTIYRYIKDELWANLYAKNNPRSISRIYTMLIDMLNMLGYDYACLEKAYNKKYEENIKRQNEGY